MTHEYYSYLQLSCMLGGHFLGACGEQRQGCADQKTARNYTLFMILYIGFPTSGGFK